MPTYDYACDACGHTFEHWQSMTDAKLVKCPKCGKRKLVRLMGRGAGVIFKGSGFYETDYKRARSSPSSDAPSTDATPSGDGASTTKASETPSAPAKAAPAAKPAAPAKPAGGGKKKSGS